MTGVKHIPFLHVGSTENGESKEFLVEESLSQVCSKDKDESKIIIVDECYTDESESECTHKSVNREKMQRMRQIMRNLRLRMLQLSRSQDILTYLNVEIIS